MKQQLEHRLKELKTEFETGQRTLADLEARQANVRETLLRTPADVPGTQDSG
jgi:hypothetical protein